MRHSYSGKQPHHCNAQRTSTEQLCRSCRDWRKGKALTRGSLGNHGFGYAKESAEAIVGIGNEPRIETVEDSQDTEGLNVE